jgi:hydroxyacylglutathione hydrolase
LIKSERDLQIVDVRRPPEYQGGHVPRAIAAPLSHLPETASTLPLNPAKTTAMICAGGYRSSAATSILEQLGFSNLVNVSGGTSAWINAGFEVETWQVAENEDKHSIHEPARNKH